MKKIICLLLCVAFVLISGCSQTQEPNESETVTAKIVDSGKYYSVYNGELTTVCYNIYNKKGETVLSEETSRPLKINMINDSIVDIGISMGTGITVHKYYDANQDLFSQEYTYVVANRNELIAYIAIPEKNPMENRKIVVQNVFDKNLFCKEFPMDFSKVDTPVVKAEFSEDGKSLQITYLSGEEKTEITETLNLFD